VLKKNRKRLLAVFLYPIGVFLSFALFPSLWLMVIVVPLFFIVGFYGGQPYFRREEPYSYWMLTMAVWMIGAFTGMILSTILKVIINYDEIFR